MWQHAGRFNKILLQRNTGVPEIQVYLKLGFSLSAGYRLKNQLLEGLSCLPFGKKGESERVKA